MLWSTIFDIFLQKIGVFLKSIVMLKFLHNLAVLCGKHFLRENNFKIITSVPVVDFKNQFRP
jgi:hypothetical protein